MRPPFLSSDTEPAPPSDPAFALAHRLQTLEQAIAMLQHDVRNPLNAIAAAVELLNRTAADAPVAIRAREVIANQTQRLAATMQRFDDLAASPALRAPAADYPDLADLAQAAVDDARRAAHADGRALHATLGPARVDTDPHGLRAALDNALAHVLACTPVDGSTSLHLEVENGEARIVMRCFDAQRHPQSIAPWAHAQPGGERDAVVEIDRAAQALVLSMPAPGP